MRLHLSLLLAAVLAIVCLAVSPVLAQDELTPMGPPSPADGVYDADCLQPGTSDSWGDCQAETSCEGAAFVAPGCGAGQVCCVSKDTVIVPPQVGAASTARLQTRGIGGGSLQERAYAEAVKMLHVRESGGNNRGREVDAIIKANGGALGEPWCGDFMAWCYRKAGYTKVTRIWASAFGTRNAPGVKTTTKPIRGDLVVFRFSHIAMFSKWVKQGSTLETIEGNTSPSSTTSNDARQGAGVHRKTRTMSSVIYFLRVGP